MADQKISQFTSATTADKTVLIPIVIDPSGTPANRAITKQNLFANVNSNVSVTDGSTTMLMVDTVLNRVGVGTSSPNTQFDVSGDRFRVGTSYTPANSTVAVRQGTIFWDSNYLYIATANSGVKRGALSSF